MAKSGKTTKKTTAAAKASAPKSGPKPAKARPPSRAASSPAKATAKPAAKAAKTVKTAKAGKKASKSPPAKAKPAAEATKATSKAAKASKPAEKKPAKKGVKKAAKSPRRPAVGAVDVKMPTKGTFSSGLSFLSGKPGSDFGTDDVAQDRPRLTKTKLGVRDLDKFRELLLRKRREVIGDLQGMEAEALQGEGSNLSHLPVHMADMGTDNYEQEFTLSLANRDRRLIDEIDHALAKIDDKTYGICEGTGQMIAKPRLDAEPWTRYSIEHARQLERPGGVRR